MNEWFSKIFGTVKEKWSKWTGVQKGIAIGIVVVVIAAIVILSSTSSKEAYEKLYSTPITNQSEVDAIRFRLDKDNVWNDYQNGYILVVDKSTAKKWRNQLHYEGLTPQSTSDPYSIWNVDKFSRTDFNDFVDWQRTRQMALEDTLESLSGIRKAEVMLSVPNSNDIFNNNPVKAAVNIYANPGSDILQDKKQIKALLNFISSAIDGLTTENISIIDGDTNLEVSDLEGMAESDRLNNIDRQRKLKLKYDAEYSSRVMAAVKELYKDRVKQANADVTIDMSERSYTYKEYSGITIKSDNPNTPFDDSVVVEYLPGAVEKVDKTFTGTGFNPEGPSNVEGHNPAVMSDMSNVIGKSEEKGLKQNNLVNEKNSVVNVSPTIDRITVSVSILSYWTKPRDKKGHFIINEDNTDFVRVEHQITEDERLKIINIVQNAVGYDKNRGDRVVVESVSYKPISEWEQEFDEYLKKLQRNATIKWTLVGIAAVLIIFVFFKIISREIERRRRIREEELLRKQQAEREQALWDAKNEGMEVTMSVEERKRAELQENAVAMAKEHPEDVAMLIRTWLMEE